MQLAASQLEAFVTEIFVAAGAVENVARQTAGHLALANLKGHDSHGVVMAPSYVTNIKRGFLNPHAHMSVVKDSGGVVLIDGGTGFGQVVGAESTAFAIDRARDNGIACVGLRNAHHLGRIGTYGEMCADAGMVSVHFVNVVGHEPLVAPFGGAEARLQTNPFCTVVPRVNGPPIVLDMATSFIAFGKVKVAYNAGKTIRNGALVDHEGVPTNDPNVMFTRPGGSVQPFGLYKGYGLALMCELLGGALVGEWTMQPAHERTGTVINNMLMLVLNPEAFGGTERFQQEIDGMVDYLYATKPAKGVDKVRIPGEPERETFADRSVNGVPVDERSWQELAGAAKLAGLAEDAVAKYAA
ncbi:MAG: malate/lactate/ureidoglycolate dehydrogenase [Gammaproteobacteria bacterium]|nr:malate/lactate/ureidoglycolate dehydrogenase [Gammaproteobacteria bacterium]